MYRSPQGDIRLRFCSVLALFCSVASLSACKMGPNFVPPTPETADAWSLENDRLVGEPATDGDWWDSFEDPTLKALIEEAFAQNLDLRAASLRVVQARLGRTASFELLFPIPMGSAAYAHTFLSRNVKPEVDVTLPQVRANVPPGTPSLPPLLELTGKPSVDITPELDIYQGGFDTLWEIDLWGEKRRGVEAASANLEAMYDAHRAMMVSVAGEVAATYIGIRTIDARIASIEGNIARMKEFQAVAEARAGAPESDRHLAATMVALAESGVPALRDARRRSLNALGGLLGRAPGNLPEIAADGAIPAVPARIALGVPADLLRRRPDVRMAEHLAHQQCAKIGKAKAAIMPSLKLFGALGLASSNLDQLFQTESVSAAYGGAVSVNGLLMYPFTVLRVRAEDARYEEALAAYESTVLDAARETEDAISAFFAAQEALPILAGGAESAALSTDAALGDYGAGRVDVGIAISALNDRAALEDRRIAALGASATGAVAIYKALGGGWVSREGEELVPEEVRERMKKRSDWRSFTGRKDLSTGRETEKK